MRWLWRTLLFWAVVAPLFYFFGLPYLMSELQSKAQLASYADCERQLKEQGLLGGKLAILEAPDAEDYCHCVSQTVLLDKSDLPALLRHETPERLHDAMQPKIALCNQQLKAHLAAAAQLRQPVIETLPDGTKIEHFR